MKCFFQGRWVQSIVAVLGLMLLTACGSTQTQTAAAPASPTGSVVATDSADPGPDPAAIIAAASQLDRLRIGTRIIITVTDIPEPRQMEEVIGEDGFLTLPLGLRVYAEGKSKLQLQDEIIAYYVPEYFQRMTVNISLQEQFFSVMGEVRNPSRQLYLGQMTVLKAIAAAGGFTEFAKKSRVYVIRPGQKDRIRVDADDAQSKPEMDIPIFPNDQVFVERRFF